MKTQNNLRDIKKALLVTAFLAMSGCFFAQNCDSINNHLAGWYALQPSDLIQLSDGNLLCRNLLIALDEDGMYIFDENNDLISQGQMYYWISADGLTVSDSLFVPSDDIGFHLWGRLHSNDNTPQQYCNIDASIVKGDDNASYLNIAFFDDQMNFNPEMEVTVPLTENEAEVYRRGSWLLDSNNDIILQYSIPSLEETHFVRFGLDGTLKHENVFTKTQMPFFNGIPHPGWEPEGLYQYSNNPLRYNYYGELSQSSGTHVIAYELDASFNILNTYDLVDEWGNYPETSMNGYINGMVSCDDGGALFVRNTEWGVGNNESTGIVKYDNDGNIEKELWFNPFGNNKLSYCSDLIKDRQGYVYLTLFSDVYGGKQLAVIKMDQNLNVVWEYCGMNFDIEDSYRFVTSTALLNKETVAVIGQNFKYPTLVTGMFLTLISKDKANASVGETSQSLRPYLCYPNPVEDLLTVHYSPDVKPLRVELLDLQGRLLGTQKSDLESIDMQNLPTGTYTMRVVLDNGKTYCDKIVKQ